MLNKKICRDCDKVGDCVMKCEALKRLEEPFSILMSDREWGRELRTTEVLKKLGGIRNVLTCADLVKFEVVPCRCSSGVAIAFDVCGRGQVLRDIVKIKQTDDELIFIDSEGRENHVAKKLIDTMEVIA